MSTGSASPSLNESNVSGTSRPPSLVPETLGALPRDHLAVLVLAGGLLRHDQHLARGLALADREVGHLDRHGQRVAGTDVAFVFDLRAAVEHVPQPVLEARPGVDRAAEGVVAPAR